MALPPRSSFASLAWGVIVACALVAGAVTLGRLPRESHEYPGIVLDRLPTPAWDGPTRDAHDAALGIYVTIPADASCARNELDLFTCRYPRQDIAIAWHFDALVDEHDFRGDLEAARLRQKQRHPVNVALDSTSEDEDRIVLVAETPMILSTRPCQGAPSDTCRDKLELVGWQGDARERYRLWVEASYPHTTPRALVAAIVTSTSLQLPEWGSLRAQGKHPEYRRELVAQLTERGHSLDGDVVLRAPAGSTCMSDPHGTRCFGPNGWYVGLTRSEHARFDSTQYTSVAEWARRHALRARRNESTPPGELYTLNNIVGFVTRMPCSDKSCTERVVLDGYPARDSIQERVRAEIRARSADDLALGWAALEDASLRAKK